MGGRNASKDFGKAFNSVLWEVNCHGGGVDDPSQDSLYCVPRCVALLELFKAHWFTAKLVIMEIVWAEDLVYGMKENISYAMAIVGALCESNKIIDKDVDV